MINISDYIILNGELYHHGILGQKWGVRRYQNKDGSLTAAGKKHYSIGDAKGNPTTSKGSIFRRSGKSKKQTSTTSEKKELTSEEIAAKKKAVLESRSAKELYKNANLFDDQELRTAYNRLVQEDSIKKLIPETKTKVDKFIIKVKKLSAAADEIGKAAESGVKIYNTLAKTSNSLFKTQMKTIMSDSERRDEKRKVEEAERKKKKSLIEIEAANYKKEQARIKLLRTQAGLKEDEDDDD